MKTGGGLLTEFYQFLMQNKKFWIIPIVVVMLLLSALVFFSGTAVAPFIYTLF